MVASGQGAEQRLQLQLQPYWGQRLGQGLAVGQGQGQGQGHELDNCVL